MFDLAEEFGTNEVAEVEGVWVSLGEDARIKVARLGNPEAQRAYKRIPRAMRVLIEGGNMGNKDALEFLAKFCADHLVKDWDGLSDDGKSVKYSREAAFTMMKKHRRFLDKVWELSLDADLFNTGELVEDAKNL